MSLGFKLQGMGIFIPNWYVNIEYKTTEDKLEVYKPLFLNLCSMYCGIFVNIIIIVICCNYSFFSTDEPLPRKNSPHC